MAGQVEREGIKMQGGLLLGSVYPAFKLDYKRLEL